MAKRFLHIILALILLISTSGFTVNKHFCQNSFKKAAIFFQPKSCHSSENATSSCHKKQASCHHENKEDEKNCCNNESEFFQLDIDKQITNFNFKTFQNPITIAVVIALLQIEIPSIDSQTIEYLNYRPPLISDDFVVKFEAFLI